MFFIFVLHPILLNGCPDREREPPHAKTERVLAGIAETYPPRPIGAAANLYEIHISLVCKSDSDCMLVYARPWRRLAVLGSGCKTTPVPVPAEAQNRRDHRRGQARNQEGHH